MFGYFPSSRYVYAAPLFLIILVGFIYLPVITFLIGSVFVTALNSRYYKSLPFVLLGLLIFVNLARLPAGDYVWYSKHYLWLQNGSVFDYFGSLIYGIVPKYTEPVYYLYSKFLSVISFGSLPVYVIVTTFLIYATFLYSVEKFAALFSLDLISRSGLLVAGLTLCLTFTLSNHLIRQCLASALMMLSLSFLISGDRRSVLFFCLAVLTHNSVLVPVALIYFAYFVSSVGVRARYILVCAGVLVSWFGGYLLPYVLGGGEVFVQDDGSVSSLTYFYDFICFSIVLLSYLLFRRNKLVKFAQLNTLRVVLIFYFVYFSFLIGVMASPLLFLRYYFYFEVFRIFVFLCIFKFSMQSFTGQGRLAVGLFFLVLGLANISYRVSRSPFDYGLDFYEYLTTSLLGFMELYSVRVGLI